MGLRLRSLQSDPTLLFLESDELRGKALPVGEDGREMRCEVPDLARQDHLALRIQHVGGLHPGRYQRFAGLKPLCRWALDRSGAVQLCRDADHAFAQYEGRTRWYDAYELRVARVDRAHSFVRDRP